MDRILLVDSYDSFSYNLASLCIKAFPDVQVHIIRNDEHALDAVLPHLSAFSAVIIGPGPGSPEVEQDIGFIKALWALPDHQLRPIFGVCLGLQSLVVEHGGTIERLRVVKHGQISTVLHQGEDLFHGVGNVNAVRYHSLHAKLPADGSLQELAHVDDGDENGRVVMAVKHRIKPFWAVQYHPESIKTDGGGLQVLHNFWRLAHKWLETHNHQPSSWTKESDQVFGTPWPSLQPRSTHSTTPGSHNMTTHSLSASSLTVPSLCELMGVADDASPFVLLDSASAPGRHSIIGCLSNSSIQITYNVGDSHVGIVQEDNKCHYEDLEGVDIYSWIATFMRSRRFQGGDLSVPFWGGLVGCLSYELGVVGLGVPLPAQSLEDDTTRHPDVNLVYVERSLVYDMASGTVHVQSLIPDDAWVSATAARISEAASHHQQEITPPKGHPGTFRFPRVVYPDKELYLARIREAQQHLSAGDSYELCLTARTRITVPSSISHGPRTSSSWDLYKTARRRNPAPHAAYLRLHPTTLISSSPERFLSFSRPPNTVCQLRPIKGTLRKSPHVGRAAAERALVGSKKEVAENLMIVDLIRHDLHGVVGEDVHVTKFCGVEEYETVWQMVSVIEGSVSEEARRRDPGIEHELGWEVLRRSLPPGSMTGAPKKRSVEILQSLEDDERGLYSGVVGYWDVGGGGDWAVTIRSTFKHDVEGKGSTPALKGEVWTLGAGGAITALSDPEAEWHEMMLKLQGVMKAFGPPDMPA